MLAVQSGANRRARRGGGGVRPCLEHACAELQKTLYEGVWHITAGQSCCSHATGIQTKAVNQHLLPITRQPLVFDSQPMGVNFNLPQYTLECCQWTAICCQQLASHRQLHIK